MELGMHLKKKKKNLFSIIFNWKTKTVFKRLNWHDKGSLLIIVIDINYRDVQNIESAEFADTQNIESKEMRGIKDYHYIFLTWDARMTMVPVFWCWRQEDQAAMESVLEVLSWCIFTEECLIYPRGDFKYPFRYVSGACRRGGLA